MIEFKVHNGCLFIGELAVRLPLPVAEGIGLDEAVAVRVDVPTGQVFNRNVYLIDTSRRILWQIEESPHGKEADKPFMNIWMEDDEVLMAGNWNGLRGGYFFRPTPRESVQKMTCALQDIVRGILRAATHAQSLRCGHPEAERP